MKNAKRLTAALGLLVLCSASAASAAEPQAGPTRIEKDLLGEKAIPADAYYGVQTARALENFQISGVHTNHYPGLLRGLGHREARRGAGQHRRRGHEEREAGPDREGLPGGAGRASTTTSSAPTGTRAAPAPPPT